MMVERFNVAGALLAKLFGRPAEDVRTFESKSAQLSQAGVKAALYGRMSVSGATVSPAATALGDRAAAAEGARPGGAG